MYEYLARVVRVIDGDTIEVEIDLGFKIKHTTILRLIGINAPELPTPEGKAAKEWLAKQIENQTVTIRTVKDKKEKYGRYLAFVDAWVERLQSTQSINAMMISEGLAVKI
jgi:micrococcal nuclease